MVLGGLGSGSSRGAVVALAGLGPLMAGALDLCLLGPLFGHSIRGAEIRRSLGLSPELRLFKTRYEQLAPRERMLLH
jgi:hypothetical protein